MVPGGRVHNRDLPARSELETWGCENAGNHRCRAVDPVGARAGVVL